MDLLDTIRSHVLALPDLAKFAVIIAVIVGVPRLAARIGVPPMVGLLLFGVALGPHVLGFFGEHRPIADFFAELGKLLLMFSAGLEIDIALFRRAQTRAITFGLVTTTVPLLFGTLLGPAVVVVAHDSDTDRSHPAAFVKDSAITTKIKSKLAAEHITSLGRIHVDTDKDGVVWLSGSAGSQQAADKAVSIARGTEHVKSVHSKIKIKKDD